MIIAIDVYYQEKRAKAVGVVFEHWEDSKPLDVIVSYTDNPLDYESGSFYKRELPCIQELLRLVDIKKIDTIVIDGYVYLDNDKKPGLGHYVYTSFSGAVSVIGVAKNAFRHDQDNDSVVQKIYRGESKKPLYVSAIGTDLGIAAVNIKEMYGRHRFPHLLKILDQQTREA